MSIRIAIIGFGKIARDEHLPAIAEHPGFSLAAVVAPGGDPDIGVPWFGDATQLFAAMAGEIDAVAICTPPSARYAIACQAIAAGVAVLLEKPPAATLGEASALARQAEQGGVALYTGWHSQHAAGVEAARDALSGERVAGLSIVWREDVRKWHAGQQWIWRAGGYGVFDPAINGLSIASRILTMPLLVARATLAVPVNRQTPIAAEIDFQANGMRASFDWRSAESDDWRVSVDTAAGKRIELCRGGHRLDIDGRTVIDEAPAEYRSMYRRFAGIVEQGAVEVDCEPLRIVADAFLVGQRVPVDAFDDAADTESGVGAVSERAG